MFILSDADLKFIVETLYPDMRDRARVSEAVRDKPDILDAMIGDARLADRVLDDEEAVVHISPRLLFTILLRQTRRDLDNQSYINEIGDNGEVIPVFESSKVADLLDEEPPRDYLADMMSSFSKTQSTVVYSLERGRLRKRRFSSMDMDDMIYAASHAEPAERPDYYRRIADIALFMTGVYPRQAIRSPRRRSFALRRTLADYEREGSAFYGLAARELEVPELGDVMATLSENFTLARRALNHLSERYIRVRNERYFGMPI